MTRSATSDEVPSAFCEESPRTFEVSKRPGVGRGVILTVADKQVEVSGEAWDAFQTHLLRSTFGRRPEDGYEAGEQIEVAYEFCDGFFWGEELDLVEEFVKEHGLR